MSKVARISGLYLEAKVVGGTSIEDAAIDACALAYITGCNVSFEFNSIACVAHPGAEWHVLVENWRSASDRGGWMANAHTRLAEGS